MGPHSEGLRPGLETEVAVQSSTLRLSKRARLDIKDGQEDSPEQAPLIKAPAGQVGVKASAPRPPTIYVSHAENGGCANQLLGHLVGLAMACSLQAHSLVTSAAWSRDSFADSPGYQPVPLESMLDWGKMAQHWKRRGLDLRQELPANESCATVEAGDLAGTAFQDIKVVTAKIRERIEAALETPGDGPPKSCIHVNLGWPYMMLNMTRPLRTACIDEAARGIFFPPKVVEAADLVLKALSKQGSFSGVHFRIEEDWARIFFPTPEAKEARIEEFAARMKAAGYNEATTVYAASGIFSYYDATGIDNFKKKFIAKGTCAKMLSKEDLLPQSVLGGLHSEQKALVDLLVLSRGEKFVGVPGSTLTVFTKEYRVIQGHNDSTFVTMDDDYGGPSMALWFAS